MIYTQKDVEGLVDITPGRGSLLISFCNLLERFDKHISPLDLALILGEKGVTDLTVDSIAKYDSNVQLSAFGQNGQPLRNDAIMRFEYISKSTGNLVTHYCLVKDVVTGTIIDSYSGVEKSWDVYGGPGSWATYLNKVPVVVPDAPVEAVQPETDTFTINDNTVDVEPQNAPQIEQVDEYTTIIPVHIKPVDPLSWQATYKPGLGVLNTTAIKNSTITDLLGENPDKELVAGTIAMIAGKFEKDGRTYYRTAKSVNDDTWYGVPAGVLIRSDRLSEDDDIDVIYESPDETTKDKVIKTAAKIEGRTKKFFSFGKKL